MEFNEVNDGVLQQHLQNIEDIRFVGGGGQKRVFECRRGGERWALKVAILRDEDDPAQSGQAVGPEGDDAVARMESRLARAEREVSVLAKCASPHIVKKGPGDIQIFQVDNLHMAYWLEELVVGEDLRSILDRDERLAEEEVIALGIQMSDAIKALWSASEGHRIVHRDINPHNIMRRSAGGFVIVDPGIALDLLAESITDFGAIPGTMPYMSPEQLDYVNKRQMDYRSDMFALGITMYEAATGHHPYFAPGTSTRHDLMHAIVKRMPQRPCDVCDDVSESLSEVIMRMIAKRPHVRYRTCAQLKAALEGVGKGKQ